MEIGLSIVTVTLFAAAIYVIRLVHVLEKRVNSLDKAIDDLGKSCTISSTSIAELLKSTVVTGERIESAKRQSTQNAAQLGTMARSLEEIRRGLAWANPRTRSRSKTPPTPNA